MPRANPFDALYNRLVARPTGRSELPPSPPPRRFAQGMAGTFLLAIAASLAVGTKAVALIWEGLLVVALASLIFGRFCLGSYLWHRIRGRADFARRTLPWSG